MVQDTPLQASDWVLHGDSGMRRNDYLVETKGIRRKIHGAITVTRQNRATTLALRNVPPEHREAVIKRILILSPISQ